MVYESVAVILFFLGFIAFFDESKAFVIYFIIVTSALTATPYSFLNYKYGLSIVDWMLPGMILSFIYKIKSIRFNIYYLIIIVIFSIYLGIKLFVGGIDKYAIKDMRYLIAVFHCIAAFGLIRATGGLIDYRKLIFSAVIIAFFTSILMWILIFFSIVSIPDTFYMEDESIYRFVSPCYYLASAVIVFWNKINIKTGNGFLIYAMCVVLLLLSGVRTVIFLTAIAAVLNAELNIKKLGVGILSAVLIFYLYYLFVEYQQGVVSVTDIRLTESDSTAGFEVQFLNRMLPALHVIGEMSFLNTIFGNGIGTTFYIPWFIYRDLDPISVQMDSSYLTLYCKFGLFGIIIHVLSIMGIVIDFNKIKTKVVVVGYLFVGSLTTAYFYEPFGFVVFVVYMLCGGLVNE